MKRVASKNILPGSDEEAKIRKGFSGDIHKWGFSDKYDVYIHLFDAACATRLRDDWTADKIGTRFIDFLHAIIATGKKTQPSLPPRILDGEEQVPEDGESSAQEDDDFFRQSTWMSVHSQSRRKKGHTRR
jgi:hypothetical protein